MASKLKKMFFETEMSWKKVLILSVFCGIIPGILMIPDLLDNTSLQQPGISFEFWIFTALLIILNCKTPKEAGIKTFVFFLISQPLIYLVQVPFYLQHWQIFAYYPRWAAITLCTLPGGMIAWFVKKQNMLSVLILSVANAILCFELPSFTNSLIHSFPRFLLTVLFIVFELITFTLIIFKQKKTRILSFILILILLISSAVFYSKNNLVNNKVYSTQLEGSAPFEILTEISGVEISIEGNTISVMPGFYSSFPIDIKDADGNIFTIEFFVGEDVVNWGINK